MHQIEHRGSKRRVGTWCKRGAWFIVAQGALQIVFFLWGRCADSPYFYGTLERVSDFTSTLPICDRDRRQYDLPLPAALYRRGGHRSPAQAKSRGCQRWGYRGKHHYRSAVAGGPGMIAYRDER